MDEPLAFTVTTVSASKKCVNVMVVFKESGIRWQSRKSKYSSVSLNPVGITKTSESSCDRTVIPAGRGVTKE